METTAQVINRIAADAHAQAKISGFHDSPDDASDTMFLARLMLVVTELAEAAEEFRKADYDEALIAEELADVIIRVGNIAHSRGLDLGNAVVNKMEKNRSRPKMHGKRI